MDQFEECKSEWPAAADKAKARNDAEIWEKSITESKNFFEKVRILNMLISLLLKYPSKMLNCFCPV